MPDGDTPEVDTANRNVLDPGVGGIVIMKLELMSMLVEAYTKLWLTDSPE